MMGKTIECFNVRGFAPNVEALYRFALKPV